MLPFISIVIPTLNEAHVIEKCFSSLQNLHYPNDRLEIIIVDGLSTDNTRQIAQEYGVMVVDNPGIRVVSARNAGFLAAKGELLAFSDADCVMDKQWLMNSVKYFEDSRVAGIGGPNLVPEDEPPFARATGLLFDYAYLFRAGAPTKKYARVIESRAHGSNAIYRVNALGEVMPVDEAMLEGEDVIMNSMLLKKGYKLIYVPDVIVYHYRRSTPKSWWRQMAIYGAAKILMWRKMPRTVTPVNILLGLAIPILFLILAILIVFFQSMALLIIAVSIIIFFLCSFIFALIALKSLSVAVNMPLAIFILPIAWSKGFLKELIFPTKRQVQ